MTAPQLDFGVNAKGISTVEQLAVALASVNAEVRALQSAKIPDINVRMPGATGGAAGTGGGLKGGDIAKVVAAIKLQSQTLATSLAEISAQISKAYESFGKSSAAASDRADRVMDEAAAKSTRAALRRQRELEAAFQSMTQQQKNMNILRARALLDQNAPQADVLKRFSQSAVSQAGAIPQGAGAAYLASQDVMKGVQAAKDAAAAVERASREEYQAKHTAFQAALARQKLLEADYVAMTAARQTSNVVLARIYQDKKVDDEVIRNKFSPSALAAASMMPAGSGEEYARTGDTLKIRAAAAAAVAAAEAAAKVSSSSGKTGQAAAAAGAAVSAAGTAAAKGAATAGGSGQAAANAAEALLKRIRRLDAEYANMSASSQLRRTRQAKTFIDLGGGKADAIGLYGNKAVGSATPLGISALEKEANQAGSAFTRLKSQATELHSAVRGLAAGFGQLWLSWGNALPMLTGAAFAGATVSVIRTGAEVNHTLDLMGTLGGNTAQSVRSLRDQLTGMSGASVTQGPKEIAEAMKTLSLAGLNAKQTSSAIRDVLNFSTAGDTSTKDAAETLVAVGTAYGYTADQFNRVGDVIAKAAAMSMASVEGMSQSFKYSSVVAEQFGVSLEDMATVLVSLSQRGINFTSAGTSARQFYQELSGATNKTRKILAENKIDIFDNATGKVRPLLDIITQLNDKLQTMSKAGARRFMQDIMNERGGKAGSAVLADYVKGLQEAKDRGEDLTLTLQKTNKAIREQSAGFVALNAIAMRATAFEQMKSTMSTLQAVFVETFSAIEGDILTISMRMKEAFRSEEFRNTLATMVRAVGDFGVMLASNAGTLINFAKAIVIAKAAQIGFTVVLNGVTTAVQAMKIAFEGAAAARFIAGFGMIGGAVAVLTGLVVAGTLAWKAYWGAKNNQDITYDSTNLGNYNKNLEDEIALLTKRNEALRSGKKEQEADRQYAGDKALLAGQEELRAKNAAAQAELAALQGRLVKPDNYTQSHGPTMDVLTGRSVSPSGQYDAAVARAKELNDQIKANSDAYVRQAARLRENEERVKALAAANEQLQPKLNPITPGTPDGTDYNPADPKAAQAAGKAYSNIEKVLNANLSAAQKVYDNKVKLLDAEKSARLKTEAEVAFAQERAADAYDASRQAALEKFKAESKASVAALEAAAAGKGPEAEGAKAQLEQARLRIAEAEQEADVLKRLAQIRKDSWGAGLAYQMRQVVQAGKEYQAQLDKQYAQENMLATLSNKSRAVEQARIDAMKEYEAAIRDVNAQLAEYQAALAASTGSDEEKAAMRKRIEDLQNQVAALRSAATGAGNSAAASAEKNYTSPVDALLKKWSNVSEAMKQTAEDFRTDFVQAGKDAFDQFLETGKISIKSFSVVMRKYLTEALFGQLFLKPTAGIADSLSGALFGGGKSGSKSGGLSEGLKSFADNTGISETWQGMTKKFSGVFDSMDLGGFFSKMKDGFSSLFKDNGMFSGIGDFFKGLFNDPNGLLGGITGMFKNLFGGGSAGGSGLGMGGSLLDTGVSLLGMFAATGMAFGPAGPLPFKNGGAFTNNVYATPTYFRTGGSFGPRGVMGEAGAEAVMPLARTSGNQLGVRVVGGTGAPSHVSYINNKYVVNGSGATRADLASAMAITRQQAGQDSAERARRVYGGS